MLKQNLIKRAFGTVFILGMMVSLFASCSAKDSIVGEWAIKGETAVTITFYEDGEYDGPNITGSSLGPSAYSVMSDGTLKMFSALGDTRGTFKKTNSKEPENSEYYLNGNTLIINGKEYQRIKK